MLFLEAYQWLFDPADQSSSYIRSVKVIPSTQPFQIDWLFTIIDRIASCLVQLTGHDRATAHQNKSKKQTPIKGTLSFVM